MRGLRARRRRTLSITSLIDVIFLLLLFFMLASSFTRFSELEMSDVSAAAPAAAGTPSETPTLVIERRRLFLEEAEVTRAALLQRLGDRPGPLEVRVSPGVTSQRLVDVLVLLEPISGLDVNLVAPS